MPSIDIPAFEGEFPRITSQKLKDTQAQVSINADLSETSLKPIKGLLADTTLSGISIDPKSIYLVRTGSSKKFWVLSDKDAAFSRAPSANSEGVFHYADGVYPRKSDFALASNGGVNSYGVPDVAYSLGIPAPTTALTVTKLGTPAATLVGSMSYVYTWVNSWGQESAPSLPSETYDIYDNEYVRLSGFEDPYDSNFLVPIDIVGVRIYRINTSDDGTSEYQSIDDLHTSDGNLYGTFKYGAEQYGAPFLNYRSIGDWAKGTGTISVSGAAIVGVGTNFDPEITANDYIKVNGWIFKVSSRIDDENLVIESTKAVLSGVEFHYCSSWMESPGYIQDESSGDIFPDSSLGGILQTEDYDEPEKGMQGLTLMANNCFAGFFKNKIRISEPGLSHAWPYDYEIVTPENVVAIGNFGTTLVAPTEAYPYIIECYDPLNASKTIIQEKQRCLYSRSLVSGNGFVDYISPDGLVDITQAGLGIITRGSFTKDQWEELLTRNAAYDKVVSSFLHDSQYHAFFEGTRDGFCIDRNTGGYSKFSLDSDVFVHGFVDAIDDSLNLLVQNAGTYYIKKWRQGADLTYRWRSKVFFFPVPILISCGKLFGNISSDVTLRVFSNGVQVGNDITVADNMPFRFQGNVSHTWEFEFEGTGEVFSARFSSTMDELFL